MNIKSSQTLVSEAMEQIETRSAEEVKKLSESKLCNLIDIRDIRELWKSGTIDGSVHIPRGMLEFWLDPDSVYYREGKIDALKPIVLFCALGSRSALATKSLMDMGFKNVSHVDGGFNELKKVGLKVLQSNK